MKTKKQLSTLETILEERVHSYYLKEVRGYWHLSGPWNKIPQPILDYIETNYEDVKTGRGLVTFKNK